MREGYAALLPVDPDASARRIRKSLEKATAQEARGHSDGHLREALARGADGRRDRLLRHRPDGEPRRKKDPYGYVLKVTQPAVVDELAAAAELVMTKLALVPVAVVRGVKYQQERVGREEHGPGEQPGPLQVSSGRRGIDEGVVALSGGTGSAKFLRGLQKLTQFTVVANVGDNAWFHGLYVCPDIDTVTYTLAGIADAKKGWGIRGDEFKALGQLKSLGSEDTWFNIGDLDFATHLFRTAHDERGQEPHGSHLDHRPPTGGDADATILPATDQHVETHIVTAEKGEMHLQEFWVKEKGRPTPTGVRYVGARQARVTAEVARKHHARQRGSSSPQRTRSRASCRRSRSAGSERLLAKSGGKEGGCLTHDRRGGLLGPCCAV